MGQFTRKDENHGNESSKNNRKERRDRIQRQMERLETKLEQNQNIKHGN